MLFRFPRLHAEEAEILTRTRGENQNYLEHGQVEERSSEDAAQGEVQGRGRRANNSEILPTQLTRKPRAVAANHFFFLTCQHAVYKRFSEFESCCERTANGAHRLRAKSSQAQSGSSQKPAVEQTGRADGAYRSASARLSSTAGIFTCSKPPRFKPSRLELDQSQSQKSEFGER